MTRDTKHKGQRIPWRSQVVDYYTAERERGPKSAYMRYAYGYSDQKPHWSFFVILGVMATAALLIILGIIPPR